MLVIRLAWKNMWRNRHRTAITMAAMLFAVLLSITADSLKTGIFDNLVRNIVGSYSGYIQVHRKGYWDERILENSFGYVDSMQRAVLSDNRISAAAPRIESFVLASTGEQTRGCMAVGVAPLLEDDITALRSRVLQGAYLESESRHVMVSEGLMRRMRLRLGDTIVLIGQGYQGATAAGKYRVGAVLGFGSPSLNEGFLFLSLSQGQELFAAPGMVTSYAVSLQDAGELESVATDLRSRLGDAFEVMTWGEMMPDIRQHIRNDSGNMRVVQGILYLLVCFGIFSTLLMMMAERRTEMGMLVAIGMRKGLLAATLLVESLFSVLCGCLIGMLCAIPIVARLQAHPIRISGKTAEAYQRFGFEPVFPAAMKMSQFLAQGLIVSAIGFLLSLYPVYRAFRTDPVTDLRK